MNLSFPRSFAPFGHGARLSRYIVLLFALCLFGLLVQLFPGGSELIPNSIRPGVFGHLKHEHQFGKRRKAVSDAFQHAWDGYEKYCFGHDTLSPVSNTCEDEFGGWGASAIDALSTAIIMENEPVVLKVLHLIAGLDFDQVVGGHQIFFFEVVIRHFGGMISAWDLLTGPFPHIANDAKLRQALYNKMVDLGDRLSCAFNSPSGIPHEWLDPAECKTDLGATTMLTTPGTVILEFSRLSAITGDDKYLKLAQKAQSHLLTPLPATNQPFPGLLGSRININNGQLIDAVGSWGAFADSFYEYLLKAYVYDSDNNHLHLERWLAAADSTIRHVTRHPSGHPEWTLLPQWYGPVVSDRMETLSWFAGGNFVLGGMVTNNDTLINYGLSIADAAGELYSLTATGLGGEFVSWTTCDENRESDVPCDTKMPLWTTDRRYQLRPEVIETWYHAYRATSDPKYLEWSWSAFEAIVEICKTDSGFSGISDVDAPDGGLKSDKQESFMFSEVLKYLYLIFLEEENAVYHVQDRRKGHKNMMVFNTEGHPLNVHGTPV